jgi:hypothetical protein
MATRTALILLFGLLIAALAGCGGDRRRAETETTETATHPTAQPQQLPAGGPVRVARVADPRRRAYLGRVDAICARIDPERTKEQERVGASTDSAQAAKAYDDTIALGRRELRQIEAVPPPPGDGALLKANVLDPVRAQLALRARIRRALAATDLPALRQLRSELDNSTRTLTGFARGYGFRVCGEA